MTIPASGERTTAYAAIKPRGAESTMTGGKKYVEIPNTVPKINAILRLPPDVLFSTKNSLRKPSNEKRSGESSLLSEHNETSLLFPERNIGIESVCSGLTAEVLMPSEGSLPL